MINNSLRNNIVRSIKTAVLLLAFLAIPFATQAEDPATAGFGISIVPSKCWQSSIGCNICDVTLIFTNAANLIAASVSSLSLIMFIVGGFFLIFSSGNEQRVETGKKILIGTVTGLAIVFFAWFAVNFIVRTAYYSTAESGNIFSGEQGSNKATIFDSAWWEPPACLPVGKSCAGQPAGNYCGGVGDCKEKGSNCICYRKLNPEGDDNKCTTDAPDLATAESDAGMDKKQCYCSSDCTLINNLNISSLEGRKAECVATSAYKANESLYLKLDYSCTETGKTCVVKY
ncbi:MAG: pilin [bacterium]|nr:pilin [bacterium]